MGLARRTRLQLTVLASLFLMAACGPFCGGTSSNTPAAKEKAKETPTTTTAGQFATVDACKLVTSDDASTAVGASVQSQPGSGGASQASICTYASSDGKAFVYVIGEVLPDASSAQSVNPAQFAAMMHASGVANAKVVTGIGDKAVEYTTSDPSGPQGIAIIVIKSNVVIIIAMMAPGADSTKIEAVARTAVGNLK